jgi:4-hydroxy-tetrahydrodipicolinate reductase
MGQQILALLVENARFRIVGVVEATGHPEIGLEIGPGLSIVDNLGDVLKEDSVLIEFTTPTATLDGLRCAAERKARAVVGTTGLSEAQLAEIREIARSIPIVLSPNMGLGVNVLFSLVEQAARLLPDFDIEVFEAHHNLKKDAPSGTAHRIAEILARASNHDLSQLAIYGRHGIVGPRKKGEIGIHSIRGGTIVGEHTVVFAGDGERLEITHRAESRRLFARGALVAAEFVSHQGPGLYDLHDVLGIRKDTHD